MLANEKNIEEYKMIPTIDRVKDISQLLWRRDQGRTLAERRLSELIYND